MSRSKYRVGLAAGTFSAFDDVRSRFSTQIDLVEIDVTEAAELAKNADGLDALIVGLQPLSSAHIESLPDSVRVIGRSATGLDTIDLATAAERGMFVVHQPDYATIEVAEHAAALVLALNRRLLLADDMARNAWSSFDQFETILPLSQSVVGIAGFGRIGQAVAVRLQPFAARTLIFDPAIDAWAGLGKGLERVDSFAALAAASDVLTLHIPLNDTTRNIVDQTILETMKPTALIVNVSRGGLVDETALARALHSGTIAGAALDVLTSEPPSPDHPLRTTPNTLLTPHIAWLSSGGQHRVKMWTVEDVLAVLQGQAPSHGRVAVVGRLPA